MNRLDSSYPDPLPWLTALAPSGARDGVSEWATWLQSFVFLSDADWNDRARKQAFEAVRAGRTARVPCGPHPDSIVGAETAEVWYAWAALPSHQRFQNATWRLEISTWAYEMASSLGLKGTWRQPHIDAVLMAGFLMLRLHMLHTPRNMLLIDTLGGDPSDPEEQRKSVWRECVRIRQHLADSLPLAQDLPRKSRTAFKLWWFTSLEWTRLAERAGEGLWDVPVSFGWTSRLHIRWQRWFGKLAFR